MFPDIFSVDVELTILYALLDTEWLAFQDHYI